MYILAIAEKISPIAVDGGLHFGTVTMKTLN